jgi:hypothetical protein
MKKCLSLLLIALTALTGCQRKSNVAVVTTAESRQAKELLQGIWIDAETDEVSFRAMGDTIFYPDSTSVPAYFCIIDDSLVLGSQHYPIVKQGPQVFWFSNQAGDVVKLYKSSDPTDVSLFTHEQPKAMTMVSKLQKTDSVVIYGGQRYHWYIAINPTRYKVTKTTYNADGVGVENIYYDNIIHISVYKGAEKLFSQDFKKQTYDPKVPGDFLNQAILGNMEYDSVDERGFHFNATLCIPDGAACYLVSTDIGFDGQLSMNLLEY